MKDERAICSIAGVTLLTAWALWLGFNGVLFMSAIAIISGLGGYILMKESGQAFGGFARAIELFDYRQRRK